MPLFQMTNFSDDEKNAIIDKAVKPVSKAEYLEMQCRTANESDGNLSGYDCPECRNRGYISVVHDGDIVCHTCKCMTIRNNMANLKKSGLEQLAERCTFDNFQTPEEWQKKAKSKAMQYVSDESGKWLFFSGQSGGGKTHLCTAVSVELIKKGRNLKYIMWRSLLHELEGMRFDNEKYSAKMREIMETDIIYIDDFLKCYGGKPSSNELCYAYEVINSRYVANKQTIISTELLLKDIINIDNALGGRIKEKSNDWRIQIGSDNAKNFRLTGGAE